jgi:hypothetical protein
LILIKAGLGKPVSFYPMNQERPPLRLCPRCRITMQAERSDVAAGYNTFTCLSCDLVLTYRGPQAFSVPAKPDRERP